MVGETISHYKILEKLGEGGMGVVYKARDTQLDRDVALKFLPQMIGKSESDRRRFALEAKAAATFNHPNICTIYALEEVDSDSFIVMEYVEGRELKERIQSGPIPVDEAIHIAVQVAEGLIAAHSKGIVHRDITSANIMVTKSGGVKIMDFGIAKVTGAEAFTKQGLTVGTISYLSPEQARGENVDHRADIWSLGVVLYEMLAGVLPFRGEYEQVILYSILNNDHPPLRTYRAAIPSELEQIVGKALQKDAANRYHEMADFLADLHGVIATSRQPDSGSRSAPEGIVHSIAVLPFTNLSSDSENEYFCDGLAEELINALGKVEQLRVVARTTAFSFKGAKIDIREVGKKLNVEAVLEGSVRKSGDRLRISVQFSQAGDGYQLWSEKYDRRMDDVFAIQDDIALTIVDKMKIDLLGSQKNAVINHYSRDMEAYQLYLKGRYLGYTRRAVAFFEKAVHKDPSCAPAFSGISDIYSAMGLAAILPPDKAFAKAKQAAEQALAIDDSLAEAYCSLGLFKFWLDYDWSGAERDFQKAITLDPSYAAVHCWYANLLVWKGYPERAIQEVLIALNLDPLSANTQAMVGFIHYCARRFDAAIEYAERAIAFNPDSVVALYLGALPFKESGMYDRSIAMLEKAYAISGHQTLFLGLLGHVLALSGNSDRARKILEDLTRISKKKYVSPLSIAWVYLGLGDDRNALQWFVKAFDEGHGPYHIFLKDAAFDRIRSAPEFRRIAESIGIGEWVMEPETKRQHSQSG